MEKKTENKKTKGKIAKEKEREIEKLYSATSNTDPFGSYTGKPIDTDDVPVQDADDL